jgi:hypothetical protein
MSPIAIVQMLTVVLPPPPPTYVQCAHKHINGYVEGFIWENRVFLCLVYCVGSLTDILHIFKAPFQVCARSQRSQTALP